MKPTLNEEITRIAQEAQVHVYDTDRKKQMVKEIESAIRAGIEAWKRQESDAAYKQGFIDGITAYAWYKDGVQHVGTTGRTRHEAIAKVEQTWNYNPSASLRTSETTGEG